MRTPAASALALVVLTVGGCGADDDGAAAPDEPAPTSTTTSVAEPPPPPPEPAPEPPRVRVKLPRLETLPSQSVALPGAPAAMVAEAGSLWVQAHRDTSLYRIDPRTREVLATVDTGLLGCGDLNAAGGAVWWTGCSATPGLVQVDPARDRVTSTSEWEGLGVTEVDGQLWVGDVVEPGRAQLRRGRFAAMADAAAVPVRGLTTPEGVVASGGSVWVSDVESAVVYRVDPATGKVRALTPVAFIADAGYLVEHDGAPWYVDAAQGYLVRIDPRTGRTRELKVATEQPTEYWGVAASSAPGRPGRLWVRNGDDEVWLVDTRRDQVVRRIKVDPAGAGGDVQQIGDTLFVSAFAADRVEAIDLG